MVIVPNKQSPKGSHEMEVHLWQFIDANGAPTISFRNTHNQAIKGRQKRHKVLNEGEGAGSSDHASLICSLPWPVDRHATDGKFAFIAIQNVVKPLHFSHRATVLRF